MRKLRSRLSLFSRKEGQPSASRDSRPTVAEARRRMKSWGSQVDLADKLERELSLSHESAKNKGEPLDYDDVISLTSSDPADSAPLGYAQEEQEMSESEEVETELSQTSCPAYEELLDVMERATARLDSRGRLNERYLSGHKTPAQVNLPFLPDLHTEVEKEWKKPFSSRSLGRQECAQRPSKPSFQEGPGPSPNKVGVLARPGLRIGDGHRRLVSRLVPLPHLRVGVEGGTGQREVRGET